MSIKDEIDIDFKKAIDQADELDDLSGMICDIGSIKMDEALSIITRSWKGQNSSDYARKARMFKNRMFETADILKGTAQLIRSTAQLIYTAEMAAIDICR